MNAVTFDPTVSVLIPAYNHARFVGQCLDSVVEQNHPVLEVLLLDDGSSDNTYEALQSWQDVHPALPFDFRCSRQPNRGVTAAANRLVRAARGDILILLASDDLLLPDSIRLRVEALKHHPSWWAVFGDCAVIDDEGRRLWDSGLSGMYRANKYALAHDRLLAAELILNWCVPGPVLAVRRLAYDPRQGVGLYDENLMVEDRDFYLRLLACGRLGFIDRPVAVYRWRARIPARLVSRLQRLDHLRELACTELRYADDPRLSWSNRTALRLRGRIIQLKESRLGKLRGFRYRVVLQLFKWLHRGRITISRWRSKSDCRFSP